MASTGQVSSQVLQRMQMTGSIKCCRRTACAMLLMISLPPERRPVASASVETDVLDVQRLLVDARQRCCDPAGIAARFRHAAHQRGDEGAIRSGGHPLPD